MLPTIDNLTAAIPKNGVSAQSATQKDSETDRVVQAINAKSVEAYKSNKPTPDPANAPEKTLGAHKIDKIQAANAPETQRNNDLIELNFSLTREERDAFIQAFSDKQDPATMTQEEKDNLQSASERIAKYVEETIAKNTERRERVEKAVGEWYSRISKRELEGQFDLLELLEKAASGQIDTLWK